eukprot:4130646-Pyramimonas_sp.AAC.1
MLADKSSGKTKLADNGCTNKTDSLIGAARPKLNGAAPACSLIGASGALKLPFACSLTGAAAENSLTEAALQSSLIGAALPTSLTGAAPQNR